LGDPIPLVLDKTIRFKPSVKYQIVIDECTPQHFPCVDSIWYTHKLSISESDFVESETGLLIYFSVAYEQTLNPTDILCRIVF